MAITDKFVLYFEGMHDIVRVIQLLARLGHSGAWSKRVNEMGIHTFSAALAGATLEANYVIEANPVREKILTQYGFIPTMELTFVIDPTHREPDGDATGALMMLRTVSDLLNHIDGDALLLTGDGKVAAKRRDGETILNTDGGVWTARRTSEFKVRHQAKALSHDSRRHAI